MAGITKSKPEQKLLAQQHSLIFSNSLMLPENHLNVFQATEFSQEQNDKTILKVKEDRNKLEKKAYEERSRVNQGGNLHDKLSSEQQENIK